MSPAASSPDTLEAAIVAELRKTAAGSPVPVSALASQLGRSDAEILSAAQNLERRGAGDRILFTIVTKTDGAEGGPMRFVFWTPLTLTDEAGQ